MQQVGAYIFMSLIYWNPFCIGYGAMQLKLGTLVTSVAMWPIFPSCPQQPTTSVRFACVSTVISFLCYWTFTQFTSTHEFSNAVSFLCSCYWEISGFRFTKLTSRQCNCRYDSRLKTRKSNSLFLLCSCYLSPGTMCPFCVGCNLPFVLAGIVKC